MAVRIVRPGSGLASTINALLAAGHSVRLQNASYGTYQLEAAIIVPSGGRLICEDGVARLTPSFAGSGADTATNALVKIQGTTSSATINTTLSARAVRGAKTITVASASGIAANQWLRIQGNNTQAGDATGMSDGANVILTEIVQVASVAGSVLTLTAATSQHHNSGIAVIGCTPVDDVQIEGVELYHPGGTIANGILCDYGHRIDLRRIAGQGFSRALIELRLGCKRFDIDRVVSNGENNAVVLLDSSVDGDVGNVTTAEDGLREHASGIPRAAITMVERCSDIKVHDCRLVRVPIGVRHWGGTNIDYDNIVIRDTDTTQVLARDTIVLGSHCGAGVDSGANQLGYESFAWGVSYNNIHVEDARSGTNTAQVAWYFHDEYQVSLANCSIAYRGVAADGEYHGGLMLKDCSGSIEAITLRGCWPALETVGSNDVTIGRLEIDGSMGDGTVTAAYIKFNHGGGAGTSPRIRDVLFNNTTNFVRFVGDFVSTPDWKLRIEKYAASVGEMHGALLAYNNTGVSFSVGDIVELDPASPAGLLYVKTASGPNPRCAVVVVGAPSDPGTGFIMVAPLPTDRVCAVTCSSAAVAIGDYLEVNASRRGVTQATPSFSCFGRALTAKAGGAEGVVLVGPR